MKEVLLAIALPVAAGGVYWFTAPEGEVYPLSPTAAYEKLDQMKVAEQVDDIVSAVPGAKLVKDGVPGESMTWRVRLDGKNLAEIRANLKARGEDKTDVSVGYSVLEEAKTLKNSAFVLQEGFIKDVGMMAISEQIDATLEDRDYDQQAINKKMTAYIVTNPGKMLQFGYDMSRMAHDEKSLMNSFEKRYNSAAFKAQFAPKSVNERRWATQSQMYNATRPTTNLP